MHKEHFAGENSCDVQCTPIMKMCVKLSDLWLLRNAEFGLFGLVSKS